MNPSVRVVGIRVEGAVVRAAVALWDRVGLPAARRRTLSPRILLATAAVEGGCDDADALAVADDLLDRYGDAGPRRLGRLERAARREARVRSRR